jgi:excisionase family DNA binding protein
MSTTETIPEVLTLSEAATYLRVSEDALQQLAADDRIPARKIGEEWRFLKRGLQAWLSLPQHAEERWLRHGPPWMAYPPLELLLDDLEQRLLRKLGPPEREQGEPGSRERVLAVLGSWKDDPTLDEMLEEIHKRRGRPAVEEKK